MKKSVIKKLIAFVLSVSVVSSLVCSNAGGVASSLDASSISTRMVSGDFNGDGKTDIAVLYDCGKSTMKIYVWLSTGSGYSSMQTWFETDGGFDASKVTGREVAGDFNGDGKTDIAAMYDCGNAETRIVVFLSSGNGFTYNSNWYDSGTNAFDANMVTGRVVAGDFNGDGKADIATMYDYGNAETRILVFLSLVNGFSSYNYWYDSGTNNFDANQVTGRMVAGDVNGDGTADIAAMYAYGSSGVNLFDFISTGSAFQYQKWWSYNDEQAPTVPTNLSCLSKTTTSVSLTWSPSTDNICVLGYYIYRDGNKIGQAASPSYVDTGLEQNTNYAYTLAAYDAAGNISNQCAALNVKTSIETDADLTSLHSATDTISSATDADYYKISKTASDDFLEAEIVDPVVSGKSLQYTISVYDPNQNLIVSEKSTNGQDYVRCKVYSAGYYYIEVSGDANNYSSAVSYTLTVN